MTFEQLFYFVEIYKRRSITAAADVLHISRQCLSKSILKLENELNIALFDRSVSGVVATPAGQELYHYATNILNEYTLLKKSMSEFPAIVEQIHTISIGIPQIFLVTAEDNLVDNLLDKFPNVDCTVQIVRKKDNPEFYLENDITVFGSFVPINRRFKPTEQYRLNYLLKKSLYVWLKCTSTFAQYQEPYIHDLKDHPFCVWRNSLYNGVDFSGLLNIDYDVMVDSKKSFKDKLRNNYFTIDLEILPEQFTYADMLDTGEFQLIKTKDFIYYYILYKTTVDEAYVQYLMDYFTSLYC